MRKTGRSRGVSGHRVPPPNGADTRSRFLLAIKDRYEKFHAVTYTDDALTTAVYHSNRYIPDRFLPDKAVDLIDEAGARVKLRQSSLPEEMIDVQKRIKFVVHRMENAIANHEFEKARFYSDEERKERENLRLLREKYNIDETAIGVVSQGRYTGSCGPLDGRAREPPSKKKRCQKLLRIEEELHRRIVSQDKSDSALACAIRRSHRRIREGGPGVGGVFPLPRTHGRGQNGSGPVTRVVPVRQRALPDPVCHVGVHGETFGLQAERVAARICRV